MLIVNSSTTPISWRVFNENDAFPTVGLAGGILAPGQRGTWHDDTRAKVELELRKDPVFGELIGGG